MSDRLRPVWHVDSIGLDGPGEATIVLQRALVVGEGTSVDFRNEVHDLTADEAQDLAADLITERTLVALFRNPNFRPGKLEPQALAAEIDRITVEVAHRALGRIIEIAMETNERVNDAKASRARPKLRLVP